MHNHPKSLSILSGHPYLNTRPYDVIKLVNTKLKYNLLEKKKMNQEPGGLDVKHKTLEPFHKHSFVVGLKDWHYSRE